MFFITPATAKTLPPMTNSGKAKAQLNPISSLNQENQVGISNHQIQIKVIPKRSSHNQKQLRIFRKKTVLLTTLPEKKMQVKKSSSRSLP